MKESVSSSRGIKVKRIASSLIVALLFSSLFVFVFTVQPARAQTGTIYIMPDGSISSPVPANITTSDNVTYTFTGDNYLPIVVNRSNIIINGMGHTLQPIGANGFTLPDVSNVTIKNTTIRNGDGGIWISSSYNNSIIGNNITNNGNGISLVSSNYNSISGNNITNNNGNGGIRLYYSSNNSISGNTFIYDGICVWFSYHNSVENNTVNGKPLVYLEGMADYSVGDAGQVILVRCDSIRVENLNLSRANVGVLLFETNNSIISRNNITNNNGFEGVYLYSAYNNSVVGNSIANNGMGIILDSSTSNSISGNNIEKNEFIGACLANASSNSVSGNNITNNGYGVDLASYASSNSVLGNSITNNSHGIQIYHSSSNSATGNNIANNKFEGVYLDSASNNSVVGNSIANNGMGVRLDSSTSNSISGNNIANNGNGISLVSSNYNSISGNSMINNVFGVALDSAFNNGISGNEIATNGGYGVYLKYSSDNAFFHNDFMNYAVGVYRVSSSTNTWDDGYPSGGNYWSDYQTRYPNATENDSSAIWNTPYVIDANNTDRYPLMGPFHTFDVGTWNETAYSVDTVCNSTITDFSFSATARTLSFNVTGTNGIAGFCRVAIPLSLMSGDWIVTVNGTQPQNLNITTYGNYTYIYFTYHHSTETVQIQSTSAIPEFQPFMLLPLFMIMTLLTATVSKRKRNVKK